MTHRPGRLRITRPRGARSGRADAARLALAALAGLFVAAPAGAQVRGSWAPEDRFLISDFSTVVALAGDRWRVYGATPNGLLTRDATSRSWGRPLTLLDGYPVAEQPSALAWSEAEQALVLGTRAGRLWRLDPQAGRVDLLGAVPGPVERLLGTRAGDVYVRTVSGWLELAAGSMVPRSVTAPPPEALPGPDDRLRSLQGGLGLDARLRRWPVTALVAGPRTDEYFAGTVGGGLLRVDARTLETEPLPYGGTGRVVSAIARIAGRLWFAGGPPARGRASVFSADTSLQQWGWPDPLGGAPAAEVATMIALAGTLWVAVEDGLYRLRPGAGWEQFGTRENLPADAVTALAASDSALWVGTRRGACLWRGDVCGPTLLPGEPVTALSYCRRVLWIGTERGLWRASSSDLAPAEPPGFSGRVRALACLQGVLYLAEPQRLVPQDDSGWGTPLPIGGAGTVRGLTAAGDALWVAGDAGAARWDAAARRWSAYLVPNDVPVGPVLAAFPDGARVWLATPAGALRLEVTGR